MMTTGKEYTFNEAIAEIIRLEAHVKNLQELRQVDRDERSVLNSTIAATAKDNANLVKENTNLRHFMQQMTTDNARMKGYVDRVRELETKPAHNPGPNDLVEVPRFVADTYMRNTAGGNRGSVRDYFSGMEESEDWYTRGNKV